MKLLVCGGRDYADRRYLYAVLDAVHEKCGIRIVIHGNAPGADTLAGDWAAERGIHTAAVQALWKVHGKAAGPRRNEAMLLLAPDGVLAFPGGRGTDGMIALAESAGITVMDRRGRG